MRIARRCNNRHVRKIQDVAAVYLLGLRGQLADIGCVGADLLQLGQDDDLAAAGFDRFKGLDAGLNGAGERRADGVAFAQGEGEVDVQLGTLANALLSY